MKITFADINQNTVNTANAAYTKDSSVNIRGVGSSMSISPALSDNNTYEGTKKSVNDVMNDAKSVDVQTTEDYMVVMSGCMSDEDFSELVRTGEKPEEMEVSDAVTIVDRIKLAVARSGQEIEGYTDTLDKETIKEMTGLEAISDYADEYDITLDEEACEDIKEAVSLISDITEMTDGMKKFFVTNDADITIDNLYLAKHQTSPMLKEQGSSYFTVETPGYLVKKADSNTSEDLTKEIKNLLTSLDIEVSDETVEAGSWLVDNSISLNEENVEKVCEVNSLSFPLSDDSISKAIAIAVSEGDDPVDASLLKTENIYEEAVRVTDELEKVIDTPFIKETRVMEETRLKMTTEANLLLLKSDYQIDTKDLESYVEKLKEIENSDKFKEATALYETEEAIETVKTSPAAVIAPLAAKLDITTLENVAFEGSNYKAKYEAAGIAYEQVATEVRKDLGDSIKKAFRNVPDILSELGLEDTKENERAVRILGYNSLSINKESIDEIKDADKKLTSVIERLTPKDTLDLIREGKSPIKMSVDELNEYLDSKEDTEKEEIEKYSKFLYKLEQDGDISTDERKDYIEVYRFFHQIEKTEGAAIGAVVNAGQEFTFGNLQTALKTAKHKGMDVTVGEVYDTLVSDIGDLEDEWISHKYTEVKNALKSPEETVTELVMNNVSVTAENLEAALLLRKEKGKAFSKATEVSGGQAKEKALSFLDDFEDEDTAIESYGDMTAECKTAIYEECMHSDSYLDVRALQLAHMQLTVSKAYAENENYEVPMEIGGKVTSVNVKLVHNSEEKGNVVVSFETEDLGKVSARLSRENGEVSGYIACNSKETVTKMEEVADTLGTKVSVVWSKNSDTDLTLSRIPMRENDDTDTKDLYNMAKNFLTGLKGIN